MSDGGSPAETIDLETAAMLAALRRMLRQAGWTQAQVAVELGVGAATVKRWLAGRGLTMPALARLCALAGSSIAELAQAARASTRERDRLTLAQEQALTEEPSLSTLFFLIVNGWPPSEAIEAFHMAPDDVERLLLRLERLALVDRLPGGRARARLDPAHVWQRAPMRRHFERHLKHHFFAIDYGDPSTIFGVETIKLSPTGIARVRDQIEHFRAEMRAIAADDRRHAALPGEWYAVLAVARSLTPLIDSGAGI